MRGLWSSPPVGDGEVEPREGGGCRVAVDLHAPGPLEPILVPAWGPVFAFSLRRLARLAAQRVS
jgi:hypothetical protein